jgi:RNA polymerase sigma-70 factor (ECF subfamily)
MSDGTQQTRDELLALRLRLGEAGAFSDLVREMERPLLYYLARLVGDTSALDVLQEVWLGAFRGAQRLDDPRRLRPWLYRLARDRAIDRIRKDRSECRLRQVHTEERGTSTIVDEEPEFGPEDAAAVHRALDSLDIRHREVLVFHFLEDLPIADIAAIAGCPEGTVKSRLYHAKRALRAVIREG